MLDWIDDNLGAGVIRYRPGRTGPRRYRELIDAWQTDAAFAARFGRLLAEVPFEAFLWETPPVTTATLSRDFEFVVTNCPELDRTADPSPFREPLSKAGADPVVRFANLGRDATLLAPCPMSDGKGFAHLAAFCREAPASLQASLWRAVGVAMSGRVSECPAWLSTSGLGVAWLHVRIDDSPKYYAHAPYRDQVID